MDIYKNHRMFWEHVVKGVPPSDYEKLNHLKKLHRADHFATEMNRQKYYENYLQFGPLARDVPTFNQTQEELDVSKIVQLVKHDCKFTIYPEDIVQIKYYPWTSMFLVKFTDLIIKQQIYDCRALLYAKRKIWISEYLSRGIYEYYRLIKRYVKNYEDVYTRDGKIFVRRCNVKSVGYYEELEMPIIFPDICALKKDII